MTDAFASVTPIIRTNPPRGTCACCTEPIEPGQPKFRASEPAGLGQYEFHRSCALGVHVTEVDGGLRGIWSPSGHHCPVSIHQ